MSNSESGQRDTKGGTRRHFLKQTAWAVSGTTAAMMVPPGAVSRVPGTEQAPPRQCAEVKAPMREVEGKVAFITGGSTGIGLGIARALFEAGMKVVITFRNSQQLDLAMPYFGSDSRRVHAIHVDVTDRPAMEQAATETEKIFGKVHVLVNNAGVTLPPTLSATSYSDWDWLMNVNLNGPFNGVRAFLPRIQAHGEGGQVVTTASILGLFSFASQGAYSVSKFAVVGMMEALRAELADTNIGISVFCPGMVNSNIEESSMRSRPADSTVKEDPQLLERIKRMREDRELTLDPFEAGRLVLRGIRNNDLYILTHPEYTPMIAARNEALMASSPVDQHPSEPRVAMARRAMNTSVYVAEENRRRCIPSEALGSRK